jgi:ssDNA-binding replication factor A large subunit
MNGNYEKILDRVAISSGVEKEELERRVEAKRAKLSGLISKEGALQVIAAELGISFENERLKINELLPGMRKVNFVGKIINLSPVRTFNTKKGDEGKVANMMIADDTANIKVVLWDTNHIALIEGGEISEGTTVEILSGNMRDNEVHMGSFSELKKSNEEVGEVKTERIIKEKPISEFTIGETAKTRAFVVQMFEPKFFEVNKSTGRKITEEEKVQGAEAEKRALINIVIDDGTESIRTVLFHETLKELGLTDLENLEMLSQQKLNSLGKELFFVGNVRKNSYFNTPEFVIESVEEMDLDKLISRLEA